MSNDKFTIGPRSSFPPGAKAGFWAAAKPTTYGPRAVPPESAANGLPAAAEPIAPVPSVVPEAPAGTAGVATLRTSP